MQAVHTTRFDSPIGCLRIASTARGLAYLELPQANGTGLAGWQRRFAPEAELEEGFAPQREAVRQILAYLAGKRERFELALDLRGTPFQRAVYAALLDVPYGETRSYAEIARRIQRPRALRAVGAANGANPIPLVIPCHRVIASDGRLGGYGGGLELKARLLAMERSGGRGGRLL